MNEEEQIRELYRLYVAFYAGWPKAWAVFNLAKEVYGEESEGLTEKDRYQNTIFFPIGVLMMLMLSTLWGRAICHRFLRNRCRYSMSLLSRDAVITGIYTMLKMVAARC